MHHAARGGLRLAARPPARRIAGQRFALHKPPQRQLSSTSVRGLSKSPFRSLDFTPPSGDPKENADDAEKRQETLNSGAQSPHTSRAREAVEGADTLTTSKRLPELKKRERNSSYGSAARRWQRNRRPKEIPHIDIPQWFLSRNVMLHDEDESLTQGTLEIRRDQASEQQDKSGSSADQAHQTPLTKDKAGEEIGSSPIGLELSGGPASTAPSSAESATRSTKEPPKLDGALHERVYTVDQDVYKELLTFVSASVNALHLKNRDHFPASRSHLKLHCPVDGATYFLDKTLETAARQLQSDLIRIDAQDIAEIAGDYIKEGPDARSKALWTLGYDAQQLYLKDREHDDSEMVEEEEDEDGDGDEDGTNSLFQEFSGTSSGGRNRGFTSVMAIPASGVTNLSDIIKTVQQNVMSFPGQNSGQGLPRGLSSTNSGGHLLPAGQNGAGAHQWNNIKLDSLLESLLETNQIKRMEVNGVATNSITEAASGESVTPLEFESNPSTAESGEDTSKSLGNSPPWPLPKTIVHIKGIKELSTTSKGDQIIEKLLSLVQKKRKEGQPIMIVGTTASTDLTPELSRSGIEGLQSEGSTSLYRTLVITPTDPGPNGALFYHDEWLRTSEMNLRNLGDMIRRVSESDSVLSKSLDGPRQPVSPELRNELGDRLLSFDEVHRIALSVVGSQSLSQLPITKATSVDSQEMSTKEESYSQAILEAMQLLQKSDSAKGRWATVEKKLQAERERPLSSSSTKEKASASEQRLKGLRSSCNKYEKRLLHGVVDPANLRTTFADVHAPVDTIEALKNLTTLSLTRPEAFKYGVLATDKITGALLYGPPGTGKTLLAKAVAKESGATVLEVSGSDVYDMYVGEGEKNVRAIFSLAKKLSPCVVFIDEADAIFASRGGPNSRNSHRELINQFLREWDGMTDTNAFIMVATNRPFDLDDAALRRLPRRLLVDLPTEKDRAAILAIHLKDEQLDAAVSIDKLAKETQLYSGSDLKNLAVAAALAAVREENDAATKHRADHPNASEEESYKFPDKRVLVQRHFDKALEEITSSVSEDMGSLRAIKKFDEKYGDRRGRKKKQIYGFITGEPETQDAAKVRS